jgi:hypothetical protein
VRLTPGTVLARRYCLNGLLGEGGMGEVWAARHLLTGKAVAVKRLICAAHERGFGEARARFALEAKSACAVEHPNVVEVYDFIDSEEDGPFIVMELLQGETLAARLARGPLGSPREVAELMLPVVSAVGTAHERGIVHRDLKPSNIFISARPGEPTRDKIKVLDFGIAKWLAGSRDERGLSTRTGSALGTPSYMAPEQATAERSADHRVDIWSLGVILYEATSGVRPLEGENAAQLVMRLLSSGIMPIEQLVPELPSTLAKLIGRMLSRDVARRPGDLREVHDVLRELAGVNSLSFGPPRGAATAPRDATPAGEAPALANGAALSNATALAHATAVVRPDARAATPTRTGVDALAITARAATTVKLEGSGPPAPATRAALALPAVTTSAPGASTPNGAAHGGIEAPSAPSPLQVTVSSHESWEELAHQTHAAFATDGLQLGSELGEPVLARAPRRRRLLGLAALFAALAAVGAYVLEPTSSNPEAGPLLEATANLASRPSPRAPEPARSSQVTASEPAGTASPPAAAARLVVADTAALPGSHAAKRGPAAKHRAPKRSTAPRADAEGASAAAPSAASRGGAPAADATPGARKKPKGVECDSSLECRSELCVAYTCQ